LNFIVYRAFIFRGEPVSEIAAEARFQRTDIVRADIVIGVFNGRRNIIRERNFANLIRGYLSIDIPDGTFRAIVLPIDYRPD